MFSSPREVEVGDAWRRRRAMRRPSPARPATPAGRPKGEPVLGAAVAQLVLGLPEVVVETSSENEQSVIAARSTYRLSRKRLPVGCEHRVAQPPACVVTQASSQEMFAWTVQEPAEQS